MREATLRKTWLAADPNPLDRAVLETLAYADVFEYPLEEREVHRYLVSRAASLDEVQASIESLARTYRISAAGDGFWTLPGRELLADVRRGREEHAQRLWPVAHRYGRAISRLPFVRFVGVSGALAVDNVGPDADVDFFIVTAADRLWTARALVVVLVRFAARFGHVLCPNYLVTERAIALRDHNLFTAHELTQMVPLSGFQMYGRLRAANGWAAEYLPNAAGPPGPRRIESPHAGRWRTAVEWAARSRGGSAIEAWERRRKLDRLRTSLAAASEASFGTDWCKGHFQQHGQRVLAAYSAALARLDRGRS